MKTDKQQRFVEAYLGEAKFCATKAAKIAGYSERTAHAKGHTLKKELAAEIAAGFEALTMSSGEVLARLTEIARNEGSNYIKPRNGSSYLDVPRMVREGKQHLIKGLKKTPSGLEVTLQDPQSALELLAKHHGLVREKVEHSGPDGAALPLSLTLLGNLDAAQLAQRLEDARRDLAAGGIPDEPGELRPSGVGGSVVE